MPTQITIKKQSFLKNSYDQYQKQSIQSILKRLIPSILKLFIPLILKQFYQMNLSTSFTNHSLNTSKSKAAYLFPKQRRFNQRTRFVTESYYDLPSTKNNRTTSFGYGNKNAFGEKSQSPPPGSYNLGSDFKKQKHGVTIAKGRQHVLFGSFLGAADAKKFVPSPDRYKIMSQQSKVSGKIYGRLPSQLDMIGKKQTPGPGAYDPKGCNLAHSGSYVLSQMRNLASPRLYTETMSLEKVRTKAGSGLSPATYNTLEKECGKSFNSKFKTNLGRSFGREQRDGPDDKSKRFLPGFKYRRFSEFGSFI